MREYIKPTIDFIELKPEERLACGSSGGGRQNLLLNILGCETSFIMGSHCNINNFTKYHLNVCK